MKFILYLMLASGGWWEAPAEDSRELCEKVGAHLVESHPEFIDFSCAIKTEPEATT